MTNYDAVIVAARQRARELVVPLKPRWSDLTSAQRDLRREILITLLDRGEGDAAASRSGIKGLLLPVYARNGDQTAYDLARERGYDLGSMERPKRQGGRSQTGLRDFIIWFLSEVLREEFPQLTVGANDATGAAVSSVDIIRHALEEEGMGVIDYRAVQDTEPSPRSAEKAVRRMHNNEQYAELFAPEWDEVREDREKIN